MKTQLIGVFYEQTSGNDYTILETYMDILDGAENRNALSFALKGINYEVPESALAVKLEVGYETDCGIKVRKIGTNPVTFQIITSGHLLISKPLESMR